MLTVFNCLISFVIAGLFFLGVPVWGGVLNWKTAQSEHFIIYYAPGQEFRAQFVQYYLETHYADIVQLSGYAVTQVPIVLEDHGLDANGVASGFTGKVTLYTGYPDSTGWMTQFESWPRMLSVHEFMHIAHITQVGGANRWMRAMFGGLGHANLFVPSWLKEGAAVLMESRISPYEGRLNDGYFQAVVAVQASAGSLFNLESLTAEYVSYPMDKRYVYGALFMAYLAQTYGPDSVRRFMEEQAKNPLAIPGIVFPVLSMDDAMKKSFGKSTEQLYAEWLAYVRHKNQWRLSGVQLTGSRWDKRFLVADGPLLYYAADRVMHYEPFRVETEYFVMAYDTRTQREYPVVQLNSRIRSPIRLEKGQLVFGVTAMKRGHHNVTADGEGLLQRLMMVDVSTGKQRLLFEAPFRTFDWLPNADILLVQDRSDAFGSEIWRRRFLPGSGSDGELALLGRFDLVISELRHASEDRWIAVAKTPDSAWDLYEIHPDTLDAKPLTQTPYAETKISVVGEYVYYSANYSGTSEMYRLFLPAGTIEKLTQGGYSAFGVPVADQLYALGLTATGFEVFRHDLVPVSVTPKTVVPTPNTAVSQTVLDTVSTARANAKSLVKPYLRAFFIPIGVRDNLELFDLSVTNLGYNAGDSGGLFVAGNVSTRVFSPLTLSLQLNNIQRPQFVGTYPLLKTMTYGFNQVDVGFQSNFDDLQTPFFGTQFELPDHTTRFIGFLKTDGAGRAFELSHEYRLAPYVIKAKYRQFEDFDTVRPLRGTVPEIFENADGYFGELSVTHPLLSVRSGSFNPMLGFGDVFGESFVGVYKAHAGVSALSFVGYELRSELKWGFFVPIEPVVGVILAEEEVSGYFGLRLVL